MNKVWRRRLHGGARGLGWVAGVLVILFAVLTALAQLLLPLLARHPEWVAAQLQSTAVFRHITAPLVRFTRPGGAPWPSHWSPGDLPLQMWLLGLLPMGSQTVRISIEPAAQDGAWPTLRDNGEGTLMRRWDHRITLQPMPDGRTLYTDDIDVVARHLPWLMTPLSAAFAQVFYRHRQRRWRQLAALSALGATPAPFPLATANGGDTVYAYVQGGKAVVLSNVCTHRGCSVAWDGGRSAFACPCHGGVFDRTGKVTAGPPPAPLASSTTSAVISSWRICRASASRSERIFPRLLFADSIAATRASFSAAKAVNAASQSSAKTYSSASRASNTDGGNGISGACPAVGTAKR